MQYLPLPLAAICRERPFAPLPNYKTHPPYQYFRHEFKLSTASPSELESQAIDKKSPCASQHRLEHAERSVLDVFSIYVVFLLMVAISSVTFTLQCCSANQTLPECASHILGWNLNRVHLVLMDIRMNFFFITTYDVWLKLLLNKGFENEFLGQGDLTVVLMIAWLTPTRTLKRL